MNPKSPEQFRCALLKLAESGHFSLGGRVSTPLVIQAIEETARVIEASLYDGYEPTASERLLGLLFVTAVEGIEVTTSNLVTPS